MKNTFANPKIFRHGESGAALLFALGTLSLILLLTMAFVADSMMQRKIAANRAGKTTTEVIAESAINHARALLFAVQYNPGLVESGNAFKDDDVGKLRCYGTGTTVQSSDPEVLRLTPAANWDASIPETWWRYVHPGSVSDPIIGRYTFAMLQDDAVRYPELKELPVSNETVEWGTVEEFLVLSSPYSKAAVGQFSVFPAEFTDALVYKRLETRPGVSLDAFIPGDWQKLASPTRGVLPRRQDYRQRFNLRRNDWDGMKSTDGGYAWVKKLIGDVNSDGTLADNEEFVSIFTADPVTGELDFNASKTPAVAALNRVADTAGTFANRTNRLYQIAANLIDYCDSDSIPTSNVLPENWSDSDSGVPLFTGNEKTRYIDRFGLTVWPMLTVEGDASGNGYFSARLRWSLLAGIVDMYGVSGHNYRLKVNLRSGDNYPAKIDVDGIKVACHYQYDDGYGGTVDADAVYESPAVLTFGGAASNSFEVNFADAPQGGYQLASRYCGDSTPDKKLAFGRAALEGYLLTLVPAGCELKNDTITITGVAADAKLTVSVGLSSLILEREETSGDWRKVDYARVTGSNFSNAVPVGDPDPYKATGWVFFNGSGVVPLSWDFTQAVFTSDPRQNLNPGDWTVRSAMNRLPEDDAGYFGFYSYTDATEVFSGNTGDVTPVAGTAVNSIADRNPRCVSGDANYGNRDFETRTEADFDGTAGLSTAFIRNAPMTRLSELGRIHRGAKWETLNISHVPAAGAPPTTDDGTGAQRRLLSYSDGDGWLLDCVTLRDPDLSGEDYFTTREFFDLNLRSGSNFIWDSSDEDEEVGDRYFRRLFMTTGTSTFMGESVPLETSLSDTEQQGLAAWLNYNHPARPVCGNRSDLLATFSFSGGTAGGFDALADLASGAIGSKAAGDKLVSDIMMRSTAGAGDLPGTLRLLVVAQSIRDIGSDDPADPIEVDGVEALTGRFESGADEITGELRMIATLVRDQVSGVFVVQSVEYLDDAY